MAREKQIKTSSAAMGCTIRIEDRLVRVVEGSEKSSALSPEKRPSVEVVRVCAFITRQQRYCRAVFLTCGISNLRAFGTFAIRPAKDTKVITLVAAQRDCLNDGC